MRRRPILCRHKGYHFPKKKAEQKLIASEERYRTLVESLPDITIRTDFEGYYLDHHIAEDLFVGKNFREILYYQ